MRVHATGAACVCLALASVAPAPAADKLPSGGFLQDPVSVGAWSTRRTTADEAGRKVLACEANWTREADLYVHLRRDVGKNTFALGLPASRPPPNRPAAMRVWFDDDRAGAIEGAATFIPWSGGDEGEDGYLVLTESGDGSAAAARLAKARKVTFAYPFEGRTRTEAFPYRSAAKALATLSGCGDRR